MEPNLVGSSLLVEADLDDMRHFQSELEERTKGKVDMRTIHWIWDEVGRLTPSGKRYQRYRKEMLRQIGTYQNGSASPSLKEPGSNGAEGVNNQ